MMIIKNGAQRIKIIIKLSIIILLLFITRMYAQNIDLTPLVNLDELQPSYDQEIIDYDKIDASEDQKFFIKEGKNYDQSFATISLLNKITAKVSTLDIRLKQNYLFEELKIYAIDCYNSEPLEKKETAVYLNIYNDASNEKIFNGWMIKSLPSISSMEHPIYDIWIDSCYKL